MSKRLKLLSCRGTLPISKHEGPSKLLGSSEAVHLRVAPNRPVLLSGIQRDCSTSFRIRT